MRGLVLGSRSQDSALQPPSALTMSITYISPLTNSREQSTTKTASKGGEPVVPSTTDSWSSREYTLVTMSIRLHPCEEQAGQLVSVRLGCMRYSLRG